MPSLKEARSRMSDAVDALRREFATVRTGKATPALLDTVKVEAYGGKMPLNQVASVHTPDATLLVVQPFDKSLLGEIEKGIQVADLGLNPGNDGNVIRVPIPPLTEERRKEFAKLLHKMAEEARVSVRHARKLARDGIQQRIKDHEIGEDDGRRELEQVETVTHEFTDEIDELLQRKEQEVMAI
ncbi:MAG: ribosome recycling factor [Gemmatimonadetes bacterium]|nr:ribosome recycling factor [Gemmatimonadota bacterium]MBT8402560.1 ribosome recycling factor [Gemmatimonadota bacterium]NNK62595.1 ribosome recycling factor [Gemmatimonadota bacterium]